MKLSGVLFLSFLFLTFYSCEKIIFPDEGEVFEKAENFEYFSKITIYDIFEVELKTDTVFSVRFLSPEKYIENIVIREDSGLLEFYDENFARWLPDYPRPKVIISFPRLDDQILFRSPVKLTNYDTLKLNKLKLILLGKTGEYDLLIDVDYFQMVTGSDNFGYYYFRGNAKSAKLWPRGSSQVNASGLNCRDCNIYNNSIGDCFVNVSHKLEARLNTAGNIIYSGNPEEIKILEQSGSGRLMPAVIK